MNHRTATIRRRPVKSQRRRDGLIRFAKDTTSQNGEDGIIARIFEVLPTATKGETTIRYCVDVGAWDGKHLSNTYSLLCATKTGWKGVMIEADSEKFNDLQALHPTQTCIHAMVSCQEGSPNSLVRLLQTHAPQLPRDFDFLCIDVDGIDYWLLQQTLERFSPQVVCVEFNPTMPNDLVYIPPQTDDWREGASLAALVELAEQHGYVFVETTLYNAFFVKHDLYEAYLKQDVPDTSIEALHEVTMGTQLYQLYNGTIKVWGCKKLLWHRKPIEEKKLQMLTEQERSFPFAPNQNGSSSSSVSSAANGDQKKLYEGSVDMMSYCVDSPLSMNQQQQREAAATALWNQLEETGFCLVRGTGVNASLCQEALRFCHLFLQDAPEDVRRSTLTKDRARRGYSPMCTENFASLIGQEGPNDLVRKFRMGPIDGKGESSLLQPNIWPTAEWKEGGKFREIVEQYYIQLCRAATRIVQALCDAIVKHHPDKESSVAAALRNDPSTHTSILTLLGYRTGTRHRRKEKNPLVAAHTDVGVVTILLFDTGDCAVLQRFDKASDSWVDIKLPTDSTMDPVFVVNIGDCMEALSGLPSTLHRVLPKPGCTPRNCLALFVGLDPNVLLDFGNESMTYEEWRKKRIAQAQRVLKQNREG